MAGAIVIFDEIRAVAVVLASQRVAVVDVYFALGALEPCVRAVAGVVVDPVKALALVLARYWLQNSE